MKHCLNMTNHIHNKRRWATGKTTCNITLNDGGANTKMKNRKRPNGKHHRIRKDAPRMETNILCFTRSESTPKQRVTNMITVHAKEVPSTMKLSSRPPGTFCMRRTLEFIKEGIFSLNIRKRGF